MSTMDRAPRAGCSACRTNVPTASSHARLAFSQLLWRFASRSALIMYSQIRSAVLGSDCGRWPERPGAEQGLVQQVLLVAARAIADACPFTAVGAATARASAPNAPGISDSTLMRARTSSLRFVSCVDVVESACGHCRCRSASQPCSARGDTPKRAGSPPTSLSETSRL